MSIADRYIRNLPQSPERSEKKFPTPKSSANYSPTRLSPLKTPKSPLFNIPKYNQIPSLPNKEQVLSDTSLAATYSTGRKKLHHSECGTASLDAERKNLQAYEYLCHVGEAREWVESILQEELAPVVDFPNSLVDGVVLAKITRHFRPELVKRIFEHPRLQFRHTENINCFFDFIKVVRVPDLFTFELIDLYEKKNIPKVIYCIHALSHILSDDKLASPMGDLVGKLDFTDDQLSNTQKGLDAAGIKLPNFGAMNRHFSVPKHPKIPRAEPDPRDFAIPPPEPEISFQKPREVRPVKNQTNLAELKQRQHSRKVSRQTSSISDFSEEEMMLNDLEDAEPEIIVLQSVCRKVTYKQRAQKVYSQLARHEVLILGLQIASRNYLAAKGTSLASSEDNHSSVVRLQAVSRAALVRQYIHNKVSSLSSYEPHIVSLQSGVRRSLVDSRINNTGSVNSDTASVIPVQSVARGVLIRNCVGKVRNRLESHEVQVVQLQSAIRATRFQQKLKGNQELLGSQRNTITCFQSIARRRLLRQTITGKERELLEDVSSVCFIQSSFRGLLTRYRLGCFYDDVDSNIMGILGVQSQLRGILIRRKFKGCVKGWALSTNRILKLQSMWRTYRQNKAYKALLYDMEPTLQTVRHFVYLLADSEEDFKNQVSLSKIRADIMFKVNENQKLERYIDQLDTKMNILLKNKVITSEARDQSNGDSRTCTSARDRSPKTFLNKPRRGQSEYLDLKAVKRSSRRRLELYQKLFYVLQTRPIYLSRLVKAQNACSNRDAKQLVDLILKTYGDLQSPREEYLFLGFLSTCLKENLSSKANSSTDDLSGTPLIWKLLDPILQQTGDNVSLEKILTESANRIMSAPELESDPLLIYDNLMGTHSTITVDLAIQDPQTRSRFVQNLQALRLQSAELTDAICLYAKKAPYHIRYLVREIYRASPKGNSELSALGLAGKLFVEHHFLHSLQSIDNLGLLDVCLDVRQNRNMAAVTRVVAQAAKFVPFGAEDVYLQPLNEFVRASSAKLGMALKELMDITDLESEYQLDPMSDLLAQYKPELAVRTTDILGIHSLIIRNMSRVTNVDDTLLLRIIDDLGPLPNDAKEVLDIARYTHVRLELEPSCVLSECCDSETVNLLSTIKHCLVYVLQVQEGDTVMDVLIAPVNSSDETTYSKILRESKENGEFSKLSFRELKLLTLEKMLELESTGKVSRTNGYQEIVSSLASDIRNKNTNLETHQRDLKLSAAALKGLKDKRKNLESLLRKYNQHIEETMVGLQTQTQAKTRSKFSLTKRILHPREHSRYSPRPSKYGSYEIMATKAMEKGILVRVSDYQEKQFKDILLTVSCNEVAKFEMRVAYKGVPLPGAMATLTLDELLDYQYNEQVYISILDDAVQFDTERLLQFIFRKFFGADT